jgi:dienelactone hydrolase
MSWLSSRLAAPARLAGLTGLTGLTLAAALLAAVPARAEIIKFSALMRGLTMTSEQCAALPQAVWITASGNSFCVRYYLSTAGGTGDRPVVMLQGDQIGRFDPRTQSFEIAPDLKTEDTDTDNYVKYADAMSKRFKGPAIYLARIGLDGSSGFHGIRHTMLELSATNQALEAIKRKHHFAGFHLIGQSGGATLVGGLLGLRTDIACAVPGSGNLIQLTEVKHPNSSPTSWIDPAAMAPAIVKSSKARILVVTDPDDEVVPAERQTGFVERLRDAGGHVEQLFVQAIDAKHHGVTLYAVFAMDGCLHNASDAEIEKRLASYVKSRIASAKPNVKPDVRADARADTTPDTKVGVRRDVRPSTKTDATAAAPSDEPGPAGVAARGGASERPRTEASTRQPSDVMPSRS